MERGRQNLGGPRLPAPRRIRLVASCRGAAGRRPALPGGRHRAPDGRSGSTGPRAAAGADPRPRAAGPHPPPDSAGRLAPDPAPSRGARALRAHRTGAGGAAAARGRTHQRTDRRRALHQRQDGRRPRHQHLAQARRIQPGAGRRPRRTRRLVPPPVGLNTASRNIKTRPPQNGTIDRSAAPLLPTSSGHRHPHATEEATMHPIIERDMARARVADPDRQAEREPMARAASLTPHTRREKRKHGRAPARTAVLARRVRTGLRAHIPPSTMPGAGYIRWPGRRGGVVIRRLGVRARWGIAVAAALMVIAIPLALAQGAGAAPVPPGDFTCGVTVFTACNQTANFDTPSGTSAPVVGEPNPQAIGCPAFVAVDAPVIQGTGNGIEHAIINNNGDGWFTSTF